MESLPGLITSLMSKAGTKVLAIRHAESQANLGGSIAGWSNVKLTEYGRTQASMIYPVLLPFFPSVKHIYCSDLRRTVDTANLATMFVHPYTTDERLRELYFGDDEGVHYDSLPDEKKDLINDISYEAPEGESWTQCQQRVLDFFKEQLQEEGTYVVFTHGGLLNTLTWDLGKRDNISNAGMLGLRLENGKPVELDFEWDFPLLDIP